MEVPVLVEATMPVDVPVTGKAIASESVGAKAVAKVEGTIVEIV